MDTITTAVDAAETLFAAIAALGVIVTGYFVGRKWFRRV